MVVFKLQNTDNIRVDRSHPWIGISSYSKPINFERHDLSCHKSVDGSRRPCRRNLDSDLNLCKIPERYPVLEILCFFRRQMQFLASDSFRSNVSTPSISRVFQRWLMEEWLRFQFITLSHPIRWIFSNFGPFFAILDSEQRFECDLDLCSWRAMIW
jgi:hypothetical protein